VVKDIDRGFKEDEYFGWRAADQLALNYVEACERATVDDEFFNNFKSRHEIQPIFEHVPGWLGEKYLENILYNNSTILDQAEKFIRANDTHGSPKKSQYFKYNIDAMSPTTARYMKVLSDLFGLYGSLNNMNIVEIGAGYGGLALVISKMFKFKNYYDVDLDAACKLAHKYCTLTGVNNFHVVAPTQLEKLEDMEIDLLISNYAFSECNYETQDVYIDKILSKAKRGYITHNTSPERIERTKSIIGSYDNFQFFGRDFCNKKHPIFTWGK
jgi:hypothetical protein